MSDDTPTQRFDQGDLNPAGDAPTERLATPGQAAPGTPVPPADARSRRMIIILSIIGGLLLIAVVAVLVVLLTRGAGSATSATTATPSATASATPTPSPTPTKSATPTPTPTPTPTKTVAPPPPSTAPSIDSFTVSPTTVYCNTHAPGGPFNQYLDMTWSTTNADTVTIGTYDPYGDYAGQYFNLPNDGDTTTQGLQITYNCPEASQVWRLEVKGQDGSTIKKEIKIVNKGDQN